MASDARPLIGFLAASLLLHAAVLGWLHPTFRGAASGVADAARLDISLLHAPYRHTDEPKGKATATSAPLRKTAPPSIAHRTPAPRKPPHRNRTATPAQPRPAAPMATASPPAKHHAPPARSAAANRPSSRPPARHPAKATGPHGSASARPTSAHNAARRGTLTRRLRKALVDGLQRYFHYPPLARERGWQGKVVLSLRIDGNGKISRLKVARSSGYPVLDRAALHSLEQVRRLPQAAAWLDGRDVVMELPVRYQLVGS